MAITLILGEISKMPLQVGALRQIADELRRIMLFGPQIGVHDPFWYKYTDEGIAAYDDRALKMARNAKTFEDRLEADQFRKKCRDLDVWANLDIARRWTRPSDVLDELTRERHLKKPEDMILELSVDDVGRWTLNIGPSGLYKDGGLEVARDAPAVWSLRLLLNLTRILRPVREAVGV